MKKNWFYWGIGAGIILVALFLVSSPTLKRGVQGRLRSAPMGLKAGMASYALKEDFSAREMIQSAPSRLLQVRKLIKRADLNIEVKSCDETAQKISQIAQGFSGIIVDSEIHQYVNDSKRGRIVLKVAPQYFDEAIQRIKELGRVELERVTGEDVTEEYVDLESRLKNFKLVEQRLVSILEDKAKQVKDILEVERELSRVREQIEMIEGRMKYLDRNIELATITVNHYEQKAMSPAPINMLKKFKQTIRESLEIFINVFYGIIVIIAAIIPILIWVIIIGAIVALIRRIFFKKS
ncbi:MAG TPA: DUF4349 domain-containing protein [Candidatus Omnitrophota bacterium]|nr:DUF4349 domain-containing protein [Candidatus Omnitrophota bacterium]